MRRRILSDFFYPVVQNYLPKSTYLFTAIVRKGFDRATRLRKLQRCLRTHTLERCEIAFVVKVKVKIAQYKTMTMLALYQFYRTQF